MSEENEHTHKTHTHTHTHTLSLSPSKRFLIVNVSLVNRTQLVSEANIFMTFVVGHFTFFSGEVLPSSRSDASPVMAATSALTEVIGRRPTPSISSHQRNLVFTRQSESHLGKLGAENTAQTAAPAQIKSFACHVAVVPACPLL